MRNTMIAQEPSLARAQVSLGDPEISYPLWPPITTGCPKTSNDDVQYPLEIDYDYGALDLAIFEQAPLPGLDRWAPLLPPLLDGLSIGEGGTPLVASPRLADLSDFDGELYVKDESQNPTWSHKDRLNLCTVSAASRSGATGIVVASSGNHGASAAAYAARAGLPCIVLVSATSPRNIISFVRGYGAAAIAVPSAARWPLMRQLQERLGFQPVSNVTTSHTGHPFGPEGYKTVAYEVYAQLGRRVPAAVFVPTGYAEILYGVWKGFDEMRRLGVTGHVPRIVACEPASRGALALAIETSRPVASVPPNPTDAYAIGSTINGYRGVVAVQRSNGAALRVSDDDMRRAQADMGRTGIWNELSSAAGLAGFRNALADGETFDGPVVCVSTSSGFKDIATGTHTAPEVSGEWDEVVAALRDTYGIRV
jgi:threonine synthase